MATLPTPQSGTENNQAAHSALAKLARLTLLTMATVYAASSAFLAPASPPPTGLLRAAIQPLALFAIGLAPMLGAALVVWIARHGLSRRERRSQLVGAAMSAVLFFPALLLVRFFV